MTLSAAGLVAGLLLTLVILTGGVTGLLLAVVLGSVGLVAGAQLSGEIDLRALRRSRR